VKLPKLTEADLRRWRDGLPTTLKATTISRLVSDLKAALNRGYKRHRTSLDPQFPATVRYGLAQDDDAADTTDAVARENQILGDQQMGQVISAARDVDAEQQWDGDLFRMVLVLAATGARFSQVARMRIGDCQRAECRLLVPVSRKGRARKERAHIPVPVGQEVLDALLPVTSGRPADAPLLERWRVRQLPGSLKWERYGRGPWLASSELTRPWQEIRGRLALPAAVVPYSLRHSSIVRAIRKNLPIRLVAAAHDTSVPMIERHYAAWITSGLEDMLRDAIVPLIPADLAPSNVTPIRGSGR
jgi:integrase